ncbi:MAG: hypothetical protein RIQ89_1821 [Bacteroidota bacterium]
MKHTIILILSFLSFHSAFAQNSNAIIFSENGERFSVILNGVRQNDQPETNVKITSLNAPNYKCRIIFEDTKLGYVDFNLFFLDPATECTWMVKKNNKGEYVVRGVSQVPLAQAPPAAPTQNVVVYHTTPTIPVAPLQTTTTTTQTTTTSGSGVNENVNINMGMNVDGMGGGININVSGMGMDDGFSQTTTTHSTTVTQSTTTSAPPAAVQPVQVVYVNGYNGAIGCPVPFSNADFESVKRSISSKSFEDSKLTIAKQVLANNCMTCSQVRDIMMLFSFEDTRLDFAKFAYGLTYDIGNYYKLNDAFTFETSIDELNAYINGYRR